MRVLFLGDIVGRTGRTAVVQRLPEIRERLAPDLVVVNGENAAAGFGITEAICNRLFEAGADVLFVDGRREAEVAWALARVRPAKIVLLAGRPLDLMRRHGRPFYFDIGGRLAERFAVRATPTLLAAGAALDGEQSPGGEQLPVGTQSAGGNRLLLTEIPVRDRPRAGCAPPPESTPQSTERRLPPC